MAAKSYFVAGGGNGCHVKTMVLKHGFEVH